MNVGRHIGVSVITCQLSVCGGTVALLPDTASAGAAFVWTGAGPSDLWTDAENWEGIAPPFDVAGDLLFGQTGGPQSPDIAGNDYFDILSISFTGADSLFTLTDSVGDGSLSFVDGASITNDSVFMQEICIVLLGTGDLTLTGTGIQLGSNVSATTVFFDTPLVLGSIVVDAIQDVRFFSTVASGALEVFAGNDVDFFSTVQSDGSLAVFAGDNVNFSLAVESAGALEVTAGDDVAFLSTLESDGAVSLTTIGGGSIVFHDDVVVGGDLTLAGNADFFGNVIVTAGDQCYLADILLAGDTLLVASTVAFKSTVVLGQAAARDLTIDGALIIEPTANLFIDLSDMEHDRVTVSGNASLAGTLTISVIDGVELSPGTTFAVLTADGGITGEFDTVIGDGQFGVTYPDGESVVITVLGSLCPADINGDGVVGIVDFLALLAAVGPAEPGAAADLDGDGFVGITDLLILLAAWGPCELNGACGEPGTCGSYELCAIGEPFDCFCWTTFDGNGRCLRDAPCAGLEPCPADGDCGPGFVCVTDTCCAGKPTVCLPESTCGAAPPGGPPASSGPTAAGHHTPEELADDVVQLD